MEELNITQETMEVAEETVKSLDWESVAKFTKVGAAVTLAGLGVYVLYDKKLKPYLAKKKADKQAKKVAVEAEVVSED